MDYLKKIVKGFLISFTSFILLLLITTLLSYLNILKGSGIILTNLLIPIISVFIGSVNIGINSNNKGWLEGLKLGIVISILLIIFNIVLYNSFYLNRIIYYSIFLVVSVLGGSFGISKRKLN